MAILARGFSFDMPHAADSLMAIHTFNFFRSMHIFGQTRGLGEIFPEIAVASSPLHGACVTDERAPSATGAICRRRRAAEDMRSLLARGCVVAIETTGVANIAGLLLCHGLLVRERKIDLLDDLVGIFEGELVAFRPADRLGVRKGRPSIIGPVDIVPGPHGALPEVRPHDTRSKLLHFFRMAG